jgi:hypothetical protein
VTRLRELKLGELHLRAGLNRFLRYLTRYSKYFDPLGMYIGTLQSLCQRLIVERGFSPAGTASVRDGFTSGASATLQKRYYWKAHDEYGLHFARRG